MKSVDLRLAVCGISHKSAPLDKREALQIGQDEVAKANVVFADHPSVQESVVVSTCNRIEFYFVTGGDQEPFQVVREFYAEFKGIDISETHDFFQTRQGKHAADHLFRVAAGIDSMVLGENQVLGQLRSAYSSSCAVKSAGKLIHRLFHQAFRVGKQVRTDTEMGRGACSVSSAAMEMLDGKVDKFDQPSILFIGINQMIKLAADRLANLDRVRMIFANRTREKAGTFAARYGGEGYGLERLSNLLPEADVVICCTSSREPVISRQMIEDALQSPGRRKLILMDLAIPRDIDFRKGGNSLVELYDLEDIKAFVKDQQTRREQAIPQVEEIIERRLDEYQYWWQHARVEPPYNGHSDGYEGIRLQEMASILSRLPLDLHDEIERATRRIVKRVVKVATRASRGPTE